MKTIIFITFGIVLTTSFYAQQITLTGQVYIHNSKYNTGKMEYVKYAYVSAPFSKPNHSDDNGVFILDFVGLKAGSSVELNLEKAGYEVVNKYDLRDVVIGRKTPLKIYVTTKDQLAKAKAELYNVSLKALTARHDNLIAQLRKKGKESNALITELQEKLNRAINNSLEAEEILNEKLESLKQRLPDIALELASTNLDFASEMYLKAYEYFKTGEIEKTIKVLDEAVLDHEAIEVELTIKMLDSCMAQLKDAILSEEKRLGIIIQSYLLKAHLSTKTHDFHGAIQQYELALDMLAKHKDENIRELVNTCWRIASVYQTIGEPQMALVYQLKGIETGEANMGINHPELRSYYQELAHYFHQSRDIEQSINFTKKAVDALKSITIFHDDELNLLMKKLGSLYEERAILYKEAGNYIKAMEDFQAVLDLQPDRTDLKETIKYLKSKMK